MEERVLTPEEHAALLSGLRGGLMPEIEAAAAAQHDAIEQREIKEYDFRRQDKFPRDQLRTLQSIHEQLVRLLNSSLAGYLRTSVNFTLDAVEQASYQDFTTTATEGNLLYVISLDPLPTPMLIEVSADLVFASLDRLLGSPQPKALSKEREPTELERELFQENWVMPVLESLRSAWSTVISFDPSVTAAETNVSFLQIALPTDPILTVKSTCVIGDATGAVRLCYPYSTLEPIVSNLDTRRMISGSGRLRPEDGDAVARELNAIRVPISVRLGAAEVTFAEILELQRGDVIPLDTSVDREIDILVNGQLKYRGRPGLKKHHLATRVTSVVEDLDDVGALESPRGAAGAAGGTNGAADGELG